MRPDRIVALAMLAFAVGYGALAWQYPLLPFERTMPFKPNTLPKGLAVAAALLSFAVLLFPGGDAENGENKDWRLLDWRRTVVVFVLALFYAAALRPLGFVLSTTLFLFAGAFVLGERRTKLLITVPLLASSLSWYMVHELLGVYLKPLPAFLS